MIFMYLNQVLLFHLEYTYSLESICGNCIDNTVFLLTEIWKVIYSLYLRLKFFFKKLSVR